MHAQYRSWTTALRLIALAVILILAPARGWAEPVVLKLSFFTSDRSTVYECHVKPFVDAVNADGAGIIQIHVYFSGAISASQPEQPKLVLSGAADMALIVPGRTPENFPDSFVFALPGLFRNDEEASLAFTRLVEDNALQGYSRFFVVGAHVSVAENIHSRKPIATISDLKGQRLRVNNEVEADVLKRLGAVPVVLPLNRAMDSLSEGTIDGVVVDPSVLAEFGFSRLAQNHYLLGLGAAPLALVMNREKFTSVPPRAQEIIRKYSGDWSAKQKAACSGAKAREVIAQLRAAPRRAVIDPSPADLATARAAYDAAIQAWTAASPHNRELIDKVTAALATLRKNGN